MPNFLLVLLSAFFLVVAACIAGGIFTGPDWLFDAGVATFVVAWLVPDYRPWRRGVN